jgi:prepilin-type N-terminal cleavage/methylation domain-containing protein
MFKKGVTLIELLVVIGIMAILFALTTSNLLAPQRRTTAGETVAVLSSDLRSQQLKAMLGDAAGSTPEDYGIYFAADAYILFKGGNYNALDSDNFRVDLAQGFNFVGIGVPGYSVVFSRGSGEASNFVSDIYQVNLTDTQNNSNTVIYINRYGTLSQVD